MKKVFQRATGIGAVAGGVVASGAVSAASAAGVDYSSLTASVDFTTAIAAIMTVFGAVALLLIAVKGGKAVLGAIR